MATEMTEPQSQCGQWFVVDHDHHDERIRGPFDTAKEAAEVRRELERHPPYDDGYGNLWIVSESGVWA